MIVNAEFISEAIINFEGFVLIGSKSIVIRIWDTYTLLNQ